MYAKRENNKSNKKRKYAMLCYTVSVSVFICLQDHWKCLFLSWWLRVNSKPPAPSPPSSSSSSPPPPYSC